MKLFALGLLVVTLAACASNAPSCAAGVYNAAAMPLFELVAPAPGATAVPDTVTSLVFAGTPERDTTIIVSANGQTVAEITSLLPLPAPTSGNPTQSPEYSASLPSALSAATTYTVIYRFTAPNPTGDTCAPSMDSIALGSFTTQ